MPRENIENQLRAVDDPTFRRLFNVALLHRREVTIEDDQWRPVRGGFSANFIQLATADERGGIRSVTHLEDGSSDLRARAARQFNQFRKRLAALLASGRSEERRVGEECRSWWSPYH